MRHYDPAAFNPLFHTVDTDDQHRMGNNLINGHRVEALGEGYGRDMDTGAFQVQIAPGIYINV